MLQDGEPSRLITRRSHLGDFLEHDLIFFRHIMAGAAVWTPPPQREIAVGEITIDIGHQTPSIGIKKFQNVIDFEA